MDFTSDDNAFFKMLLIFIVFGLSLHFALDIVKVVVFTIFNGFCLIFRTFFHSTLQFIILLNLISIVILFQKYQSSLSKLNKMKSKTQLSASFAALWILTVMELNSIKNTQYPNSTLVEFIFQIISVSTFIIGIIFYVKFSSTATFHKITTSENQSCPICMDVIVDGVAMNECNHSICLNNECGYNYIKHSVTDITKYPINCFQYNCNAEIHKDLIKYIIHSQMKQDHNKTSECRQLLSKYHRFNLIINTPRHLRIDCPNADCQNILIKNEPPLNRQFNSDKYPTYKQRKHYKPLKSVKKCESDLCLHSFSMLKWRYNCTICGNVFCHQCVRFKMQMLELGYVEAVDLCMACFTSLFCIQCKDCKQMICYRCEEPWHNVCDKDDLKNGVCAQIVVNDKVSVLDAKTKRMMKKSKFQSCPKCGIMVEKVSGCNHMTHAGCLNKTEANGTHFCYTCGELLYGRYHNEEQDGKRHFPKGVYKECRKPRNSGNVMQNCLVM